MAAVPKLSVAVRQDKRKSSGAATWGAFWREPRQPGAITRKRHATYFATEAEARAWAADLVEAATSVVVNTAPPAVASRAITIVVGDVAINLERCGAVLITDRRRARIEGGING